MLAPARKPARGLGGTLRAVRELVASLRLASELCGERVERGTERVERGDEIGSPQRFGLRLFPLRVSGGELHPTQHLCKGLRGVRQRCVVARGPEALDLGVARELSQLARSDLFTEEQRGGVG